MRIRTQFLMTMLLFGIILVVVAASAVIMHQQVEKNGQQEAIADNIVQGANELSYLTNDYLFYRESQQLKRWQSRFTSFSNQVASLNVDKLEQQVLVRNIQANQKRLKEIFNSVVSASGSLSRDQGTSFDPTLLQVSWSRMAVQSQGLVSDASRLSQLLHRRTDYLREIRTILMYVMVGLFGLFLLVNYMLTYRRILKSLATLEAGTAVIGSGNLDFTIEEKGNDEIEDLSRAFNQMTTNLKTVTASKADLETEIADRKKAEENLRSQQEWLSVTLSSIGDAVIATDTKGQITFLNPVAATLTGWESKEALGQSIANVFQIINEKTRQLAQDLVARVLNEKRVVALANDTALVTKDGREIPIEDSAAPIADAAGNVAGVVLVFHDVTQKRRAQMALREAHKRAVWLARFPDENPNPVLRASADGVVLYCNPASAKFPGWRCEVGQLLQDELLPLISRTMAEGNELQWDIQIQGRFYFIWIAPFPEERYANIYARDITERKKAEQKLLETTRRFQTIADNAPIAIYVKNRDGRFVFGNRRLERYTGYPLERLLGMTDYDFAPKKDADRWRENDLKVLEGQRVEFEETGTDRDGRPYVNISVKFPLSDESGTPVEVCGISMDITERKRMEEELRQSEEKSRLLIRYAPSMIYEIDFNRPAFISVNDTMCQFLGYTREELLAMNPFDLLDDEGKALFRDRIRRKFAGEDISESVEYKSKTKDGRDVYGVLNISFTYKDGKPQGAVVVAHDITDRKRAEEALRQKTLELQHLTETLEQQVRERTEEVEAANEALMAEIHECQRVEIELKKSESSLRRLSVELLSAQEKERKTVAGEIHDSIGSSLAAIKFKVDNALTELADKSPETTSTLKSLSPVIQGAIDEARRIQMNLRPSMLDDLGLLATIRWFCRQFESTYSRIRISQDIKIEEHEVPGPLRTVIFRVLQEGLNNVAKHSKAKMIMLFLRKTRQSAELVISDDGQGFDVEKILDPKNTKGGLGLTNMRERAELSGGSFNIESTQGKGTTIRASWPI